jgi:hypothetical protein
MATKLCPLLKKECIEHQCAWYTHIIGQDPQSGKALDHWDCAIQWIPMLLVDGTQQQRQTGAAVESFRNEMVVANAQNLAATLQQKPQLGSQYLLVGDSK